MSNWHEVLKICAQGDIMAERILKNHVLKNNFKVSKKEKFQGANSSRDASLRLHQSRKNVI